MSHIQLENQEMLIQGCRFIPEHIQFKGTESPTFGMREPFLRGSKAVNFCITGYTSITSSTPIEKVILTETGNHFPTTGN